MRRLLSDAALLSVFGSEERLKERLRAWGLESELPKDGCVDTLTGRRNFRGGPAEAESDKGDGTSVGDVLEAEDQELRLDDLRTSRCSGEVLMNDLRLEMLSRLGIEALLSAGGGVDIDNGRSWVTVVAIVSLELSAIYAQVMTVHLICGLGQDPLPRSPAEHLRVSKMCAGASMLCGSISQYAAVVETMQPWQRAIERSGSSL